MYGVTDYGRMLADRVRVDAYRRALAAVVVPGATVVDLGAGTGFFALEACRLGAGKVYAIETNEAAHLIASTARRNGFADRIEVITRPSTEVNLESPADVVVADLRGVVPLFLANLEVMADARARFLRPGGVLVPRRDVLKAAVASAPRLFASIVDGWENQAFDLSMARTASLASFHHDRRHPIAATDLVTAASEVATFEYGDRTPELVDRSLAFTATRSDTAHGLVLWFDATLYGEIGFTTAPGSDRVYGRGFLPFARPLDLEAGDAIEVDLAVRRGMGDHIWAWRTTTRRNGEAREVLDQSTFYGLPTDLRSIMKESSSYTPKLAPRGLAVRDALAAMDGETPVLEIARRIHGEHRGAFASAAEALEEVRRLARKLG